MVIAKGREKNIRAWVGKGRYSYKENKFTGFFFSYIYIFLTYIWHRQAVPLGTDGRTEPVIAQGNVHSDAIIIGYFRSSQVILNFICTASRKSCLWPLDGDRKIPSGQRRGQHSECGVGTPTTQPRPSYKNTDREERGQMRGKMIEENVRKGNQVGKGKVRRAKGEYRRKRGKRINRKEKWKRKENWEREEKSLVTVFLSDRLKKGEGRQVAGVKGTAGYVKGKNNIGGNVVLLQVRCDTRVASEMGVLGRRGRGWDRKRNLSGL